MALSGWSTARPKKILVQQRRAHKNRDNSALFCKTRNRGTEVKILVLANFVGILRNSNVSWQETWEAITQNLEALLWRMQCSGLVLVYLPIFKAFFFLFLNIDYIFYYSIFLCETDRYRGSVQSVLFAAYNQRAPLYLSLVYIFLQLSSVRYTLPSSKGEASSFLFFTVALAGFKQSFYTFLASILFPYCRRAGQ